MGVLLATAAGVPSCLAARVDIPHGQRALAVVAADMNGDGDADLVVASDYGTTVGAAVSVRLGNGTGRFLRPIHAPIPSSRPPNAIAVGDVNGDGSLDVAATDPAVFGVHVLAGDGGGRLAAQSAPACCEEPRSVVAGDLDGDPYADVAVACRDDGGEYLNVFRGSESGDLVERTAYRDEAGTVAFGAALGDVDADGDQDVITAGIRQGGKLRVHINDGAGRLEPLPFFAGGMLAVALMDVTGDGKLDAIATEGESLRVLAGRGDGTFALLVKLPVGGQGTALAVAHIDADPHPDIAVARPTDNALSVFWGTDEPGQFTRQDLATAPRPTSVSTADFNGDGLREVVTANDSTPGSLTVLRSLPR